MTTAVSVATATQPLGVRLGRQLASDPWGRVLPILPLTASEMNALLEYSATMPTGKTIGKRWKCCLMERSLWASGGGGKTLCWTVGEYALLSPEDQLKWPGEIAILWFLPVVDGGQPGEWSES